MTRNSGIFWAMFTTSMLTGNIFVFFLFQDMDDISTETRMIFVGSLFAVGFAGSILLLFLLPVPESDIPEDRNMEEIELDRKFSTDGSIILMPKKPDSPLVALRKIFQLLKTKNMILLCTFFFYLGAVLTFSSGVITSSIGFTLSFE